MAMFERFTERARRVNNAHALGDIVVLCGRLGFSRDDLDNLSSEGVI